MKGLLETLKGRDDFITERVFWVYLFKAAMKAAGLEAPTPIVEDGQVHYFSNDGVNGSATAWYVFNGAAGAGMYGDSQTGLTGLWPEPVYLDTTDGTWKTSPERTLN